MSDPPYTLHPVADTGRSLRDLQPLVEAVFGAHDRAPGWFVRKLAREAVDPTRSLLALGPDRAPLGYLLLNHEPDQPVGYSGGLGVLPHARRLGVGAALLTRALHDLPRAGLTALEMTTEPAQRRFYERLGFIAGATCHTLGGLATGLADLDFQAHPPRPWPLPGRPIAAWRPGTWSRTPPHQAATLTLADGRAWAHLSREGRAVLVQRLCLAEPATPDQRLTLAHAALEDLRRRLLRGTPLWIYGCSSVSCITAALLRSRRWWLAQTGVVMLRTLPLQASRAPLRQGVDRHARPAA